MPLTPRSRVYEAKLEQARKKDKTKDAFAFNRNVKGNALANKKRMETSRSMMKVSEVKNTRADEGPPSIGRPSMPASNISGKDPLAVFGAYGAKMIGDVVRSPLFKYTNNPITVKAADYIFPKYNEDPRAVGLAEQQRMASGLLENFPIVGDIASIAASGAELKDKPSLKNLGLFGLNTGLSLLNPIGGSGQVKNVAKGIVSDLTVKPTKKETDQLRVELEEALARGDDETADNIEAILKEAAPTRPVREAIEEVDKVKSAVKYADAVVKNPQADVVITAPDRTAFDALRWRVESGSEQEFASVVEDVTRKAPSTTVSYVLKPYGATQKRAQVDRFWVPSANKALGRAESALKKAGVDIDSLRTQGRNYSDEDIASMHSASRNTEYQVWERVKGSPIFWDKKKGIARAKDGGKVQWDESAGVFRISKKDGSEIEYNPKSKEGHYYVHRGDHIDHLIPKDLIAKRVEELIDAGNIATAERYYTFMNNPANFFALHGGVNSSKTNTLIKNVKELAPKSGTAKRNIAVFNAQSDEYQTQLDNAWSQLSDLVGAEEADLFYKSYKKNK